MLSKQRINIEKLILQHDEVIAQNQQLKQMVEEACCRVPGLEIMTNLPVGVRVHKLASGFCKEKEEVRRVHLDLNLQTVELQLKAQPSMPSEVREKHTSAIQKGLEEIRQAIQNCTAMLEESFTVLTSLPEDPNIQHLEMEARELQVQYESVYRMVQIVILTQRFVKLQQAKLLKEHVDVAWQKEAVLKACVQPWIDEALLITADNKRKLAQMKVMHDLRQGFSLKPMTCNRRRSSITRDLVHKEKPFLM